MDVHETHINILQLLDETSVLLARMTQACHDLLASAWDPYTQRVTEEHPSPYIDVRNTIAEFLSTIVGNYLNFLKPSTPFSAECTKVLVAQNYRGMQNRLDKVIPPLKKRADLLSLH
jgi:hypothetical protein